MILFLLKEKEREGKRSSEDVIHSLKKTNKSSFN